MNMKKAISVLLALLLCVLALPCCKLEEGEGGETEAEFVAESTTESLSDITKAITELITFQEWTGLAVSELAGTDAFIWDFKVDIPALGIYSAGVSNIKTANLINNDLGKYNPREETVFLLEVSGGNTLIAVQYYDIDRDTYATALYHVTPWPMPVLLIGDVDGDGLDEIVFQTDTSGATYSHCITYVLKLVDGKLIELPISEGDHGFSAKALDGKMLEVLILFPL